MKPKRSRDIVNFRQNWRSVLNSAPIYQLTSDALSDALENLRCSFNVPAYAWQEAYTWRECLVSEWHRRGELVYCVAWQGETLPVNWNTLPEPCREAFRRSEPLVTGHYWLRDGKIGRPWFTAMDSTTRPAA